MLVDLNTSSGCSSGIYFEILTSRTVKIISPNTRKNAITRLITIVQSKAFFLEVSQRRKKFIKKK
jgi:hypothetical protein